MNSNSEMQWRAENPVPESDPERMAAQLRAAHEARVAAEKRALQAEREAQGELAAQAIVVASLEDHLAAVTAEKDKATQRLADLERRLHLAQQAQSEDRAALRELERKFDLLGPEPVAAADLAVEKAGLQERLEQAQHAAEQANARSVDLRRQLKAARRALQELRESQGREGSAVLTQRLHETRARAARLEGEKAAVEAQIVEQRHAEDRLRDETERMRQDLTAQAERIGAEKARLEKELGRLQQRGEVARNLALEDEVKRLQTQLAELANREAQAKQAAQGLQALVVERSERIAQFEHQNRELREAVTNAEGAREAAEKARDLAEQTYASTQQELEEFGAKVAAEGKRRAKERAHERRWSVVISLLLGACFGASLLLLLDHSGMLGEAKQAVFARIDDGLGVGQSGRPAAVPATGLAPANQRSTTAASSTAAPPGLGQTRRDALRGGGWGPQMMLLPGGTYSMGSAGSTLAPEEQPQHAVHLEAFYIGRFEVTFEQYDRFAAASGRGRPDDHGWGRGDRPAIGVSWDDARAYAEWLSAQTGAVYRLPSEAEWEYAARAGTDSPFWWGYEAESNRANCFDCGSDWDFYSTAPVGHFGPNGFGLFDTAGNVMEWVADCYYASYVGAPADGTARSGPDCSKRVVRGGAFNKPADSMRSTKRGAYPEGSRLEMLGFRVVRER